MLHVKFRKGIDPRDELKAAQAEMAAKAIDEVTLTTLSQVLDAYISRPGKLKDSTKAEMRRHVEKVFAAWADKPILAITEDDVRTRHQEMATVGLRGRPAAAQARISLVTLRTLINFAARRYKLADGTPLIKSNPVLASREDWVKLTERTRDIESDAVGNPPRVVRHVGWRRCMKCRRAFWSDDVVAVRMCMPCKTPNHWESRHVIRSEAPA